MDRVTGQFTWAPAAGFLGNYDFVFVRWKNEEAVGRRDVRIVIAPSSRK